MHILMNLLPATLILAVAAPVSAATGYGSLPAAGCPSHGEFYLDHFAPIAGEVRLLRGSQPVRAGVDCLAELGVTAIIDVRSEQETGTSGESLWASSHG